MKCTVLRVDAFTNIPGQGNPAGVVLDGDRYTDKEMQSIAKNIGYNETVFVCKSQIADIRLRYFTPGHETPLCGHATVGAIFALYKNDGSQKINIETGAGILPVQFNDEKKQITMRQAEPKFIAFQGDKQALCNSLGIKESDLHQELPVEYGNTGSWTLLVPVKNKQILDIMKPATEKFPEILKEVPHSSIHPFSIDSKEEGILSARHFSSPYSGTKEDSVTGTASGVMGAYLMNYLYISGEKNFLVQQGRHLQKEGTVVVNVIRKENEKHEVYISGNACLNESFSVETADL
ncbi:PhzF family phenazine biosynthesis protein [Enterococcus rivorum]|uniref:Phenazine biosynthesis protein PhzF n=1 Tax=Enterococcus rivorum TaxID=762845 RepID=A0A1E5KT41_9ENTE|nr:PhzF family phenazine biosynthesis isomerase [Enterococcus rivorum]MBP2098125.1 PhzF family phenazine biosynthesis protein [Enterococcus rivorum]OEH81062.1 phenazine biosynthesis protein PhzF [Enterococcus rivorum]